MDNRNDQPIPKIALLVVVIIAVGVFLYSAFGRGGADEISGDTMVIPLGPDKTPVRLGDIEVPEHLKNPPPPTTGY